MCNFDSFFLVTLGNCSWFQSLCTDELVILNVQRMPHREGIWNFNEKNESIMFRLNLINSKNFQIYSVIWFFSWWFETWSKKKFFKECATFIDHTYTLYWLMIATPFSAGFLDNIIFSYCSSNVSLYSLTLWYPDMGLFEQPEIVKDMLMAS